MQETSRIGRPCDEVPALIFLIFDIILSLSQALQLEPLAEANSSPELQMVELAGVVDGAGLHRDEHNNSRTFVQEKAEC